MGLNGGMFLPGQEVKLTHNRRTALIPEEVCAQFLCVLSLSVFLNSTFCYATEFNYTVLKHLNHSPIITGSHARDDSQDFETELWLLILCVMRLYLILICCDSFII